MWLMLFIIWLALCSWLAGGVFKKIFPVAGWIDYALGALFSLALLGLTANVFAAWFKLTDLAIIISFILTALVLSAWLSFFNKSADRADLNPETLKPQSPLIWVAFALSAFSGFFIVYAAPDAGGLSSPWQVLTSWLLLPVLICAFIIFKTVIHGDKAWKTLGAIVIFSFLIHSYLFVYSHGFGGDRFRHLASEERIISGLEYQPTLLSDNLWLTRIGPLKIPTALIDSAKLSYGFQWSLEVIASKISGIDVFQINRFLLPILWSLFLPLLMYAISLLVWPDRRIALLAAALSNSLYLLQYYGSQGLPASYGFLVYALASALWLAWSRQKDRKIMLLSLFFSVLAYFGYSLAFMLIIIFGSIVESMHYKKAAAAAFGVLAAIALFLADSGWPLQLSFAFSRLNSAWHDGNLLFFQSGSRLAQFIGPGYQLINFLFLIVFVGTAVWLAIKLWREGDEQAKSIALFLALLLAAYLASWLFISNDHVLARRLTLFAILPLILLMAFSIKNVFDALPHKKKFRLGLVAFLSLFTAYSYFSGPVLGISVTGGDLVRAQGLLPGIKADPGACVKEPLPVILALEYISAKQFQETINNINCNK